MIRTLLGQVGEYKRASLLTPLFTGLEVVMEVLIPYVTAAIIDKGIEAGDIGQVYLYGGLMPVSYTHLEHFVRDNGCFCFGHFQ